MESLTADDPSVMGEFRLRARLGSGGMGRVYLGFSPAGRAVAIKVVHQQLARDPEFLERFGREVAAARSVSGMYTAPVVAAGLNDDPPWLATAFVPGPSLAEVVQRHGPLKETAVWRLGAGLAEALRAVHAAGLVHRDLKPANVLVAADGPHVIDFGISRALEGASLTSAGMVVGTPGYMSPEQAEGRTAGPASDVFSLGCVLAYAATGNAPFGGGSAASILYKVVTGEPDLSGISPALRDVIAACVAKSPAGRPSLAALIAMIAASGPEIPGSLGAFWPEPMASIVAAGQGYPGVTAAGPAGNAPLATGMAGAGGMAGAAGGTAGAAGGTAGAAGGVSPAGGFSPARGMTAGVQAAERGGAGGSAQLGYVPTAMVPPGQSTPNPAPGSPAPGFAGHAGMLPDGYYSAAAGNPATPQPGSPAGYGAAGYGDPGYGATQTAGAAWGQPPTHQWPGAAPAGTGTPAPPWSQQPTPPAYGQPGAGQPGSMQPGSVQPGSVQPGSMQPGSGWPQPQTPPPAPSGQPGTPWPGQGGTPAPWVQYTPGRRRPMNSEVPSHVLLSIRLMWAGLVASAVEVIFGVIALGRFDQRAGPHPAAPDQLAAQSMAGIAAISAVVSFVGLFCWVWLAIACRRGRGWTRIAAAVLAGLNTVLLLFIILGTHDILGTHYDSGLKAAGCVAWILGLAAAVLLWGNQARSYFLAWRK